MLTSIRISIASLLVTLVVVPSVGAITGGRLDGDAHPYVGALVVDGEVACSGVLIAPTIFATAGHCTAGLAEGARVGVSFDTALETASWTPRAGSAHTDPLYKGAGADPHDLAVVVLDAPAPVAPARLPLAGSLDTLAKGVLVTSVGYGYNARAADGTFLYDGLRRSGESPVSDVGKALLKLSTSGGGPCLGDSGGPQLLGETVLSLTGSGAKDCSGKAQSYRLDTPSARAFLGRFVALP